MAINAVGPSEQSFQWIDLPGLRVYSYYWTPNCNLVDFRGFLLQLELNIRSSTLPVIVAGDFNAKSRMWGSPIEDDKGILLADMVSALDLLVCNDGQALTFVRGSSK